MVYKDEFVKCCLGDCRELVNTVPDNSIDLIFTDPPYPKEYLPLYGWLAETSMRILKPDGFVLVYCGGYYKNEIYRMMDSYLEYFWDFSLKMGNSSMIWPKKVIARSKAILAYRIKGSDALPLTNVLGHWDGGVRDKRYHTWGQDEKTTKYFIECFSMPGEIVLEPFGGGGTTPFVCKRIGRHCLVFENNEEAFETIKGRLDNTLALKKIKQLNCME